MFWCPVSVGPYATRRKIPSSSEPAKTAVDDPTRSDHARHKTARCAHPAREHRLNHPQAQDQIHDSLPVGSVITRS